MVDGRDVPVAAGTILHVPLGVVHAFKNNSGQLAKILVQTIPAGFEKMVADCGKPVSAGASPAPPTDDEIQRFLAVVPKYGIEILPPQGR